MAIRKPPLSNLGDVEEFESTIATVTERHRFWCVTCFLLKCNAFCRRMQKTEKCSWESQTSKKRNIVFSKTPNSFVYPWKGS